MNEMDWDLRDLLDTAVGEPPRRVTIEAVRRNAVRRRATRAGAACLAVVLAASVGAALSAGTLRAGPAPASGTGQHAGPPRYYLSQILSPDSHQLVLEVRSKSTGRVTAVIRNPPLPARCGEGTAGFAASGDQRFFLICAIELHAQTGSGSGPAKIESVIYRFTVTSSGRVTDFAPVKGGVLKGVWADNIAATADGSRVAVEVLRPEPSGKLYTNTIPEGIFVINTTTGSRTLWRSGPYVVGTLQFAGAASLSFTADGRELVVLEARCHRGRYESFCNDGHADMQVRAYSLPGGPGSLEDGTGLLDQSQLKPRGTSLSDAFITPDGSAVTAVLTACPAHGTCTLSVARISAGTARVLRVLYRVRSGTRYEGIFDRFASIDPSGRYLILDAGAGTRRVNGWIDHGRLVPLVPADGNAPSYEAW